MTKLESSRPKVPAYTHAVLLLPFAVPILITFALIILVGNQWPRDIALGSGLKLAGLCFTAVTAVVVWLFAVRHVEDKRVHVFAAVLCGVTGLMGWPVWSTGVLPSINGSLLAAPITVPMSLERIETTPKSKSNGLYHWAWLKADNGGSAINSGRYFITEDVFRRFQNTKQVTVNVTVARGLLGAQVVTGFD